MSLIRECVNHTVALSILEESKIPLETKKEVLNVGAGLSGASLAAIWATIGMGGTAAGVKSLLLAAGFLNPVAVTATASAVSLAVAGATVYAGGKLAYDKAKQFTSGKDKAALAFDKLIKEVRNRDSYLKHHNSKGIEKSTEKVKSLSKELHDITISMYRDGEIDADRYHVYMQVSKKGLLGRLSTIV